MRQDAMTMIARDSTKAAFTGALQVCLFLSLSISIVCNAQDGKRIDPVEEELRFADGLGRLGLPDYQQIVLDGIKNAAGAGPRLKAMQLEGLTRMGKWEEAKQVIAREADQNSATAWAMKLTLAKGYFAHGKYPQARGIYEAFMTQFSGSVPADLQKFYLESVYEYAQMMKLINNEKAAAGAYEKLLKVKQDRDMERRMLAELGDLYIEMATKSSGGERTDCMQKAEEIAGKKLLWDMDVWFGKGVVIMAHVKFLQGKFDEADEMVKTYMPQLKQIDETLKKHQEETGQDVTALNPMADVRYLIGKKLMLEAEKAIDAGEKEKAAGMLVGKKLPGKNEDGTDKRTVGALQHLVNVFLGYPSSPWAPDAGTRARRIQVLCRDKLGLSVGWHATDEQMQKVVRAQFQQSRIAFNQNQFKEAAEAYVRVLNAFPDDPLAPAGFADLSMCYIEMCNEEDYDIYARMAATHLAERFGRNPKIQGTAGDQLLRIADYYRNLKLMEKEEMIHKIFFDNFPTHPRVPGMLMTFGARKMKANDYRGAIEYFGMVTNQFPNSPGIFDALGQISAAYHGLEDYTNELVTLNLFIEKLKTREYAGHGLVSAMYSVAAVYQKTGENIKAYNQFSELVKMLSDPKNPYQKTPEDQKANEKILEASMYFQAACLEQMKEPAEKIPQYQKWAIAAYEKMLQRFPKTVYAPGLLSKLGALNLIQGNNEAAEAALRRLEKEFPEAPEAKISKFMQAYALLKLGKRVEAVRAFKEMFEQAGTKYTAGNMMTAANELLKADEYEIAADAFTRVLGMVKDPIKEQAVYESALIGRAKSYVGMKKMADAMTDLEKLLQQFPKTGYTIEVHLLLSKACASVASEQSDEIKRIETFNKSVKALNRAIKFMKADSEDRLRSAVDAARVSVLKARAEERFGDKAKTKDYLMEAIGSYQSILLMTDLNKPEFRPHIETTFYECVPLMVETKRYQEVANDVDKYLELFPTGKWRVEMQSWRNKAQIALMSEGKTIKKGVEESTIDDEKIVYTNAPGTNVTAVITNAPAASTNVPPAGTNAPAGDGNVSAKAQ